jgi:cyclase
MFNRIRLIPRLDIKGKNLIKGVQLEGLRVIGSPNEFALKYYEDGADELILMDVVASLYGRNQLEETIREAAKDIFIPVTVGGGIRSVSDAKQILRSGADKVAINTAAVRDPDLISSVARAFGSQCMVASIEAKKIGHERWEVFVDNGRERTGIDVSFWAKEVVRRGAGEILLTSIDREGTRTGYDVELTSIISDSVSVPVVASGGMGKVEDLLPIVIEGQADAVAMADILHYGRSDLFEIREFALTSGLNVRTF